MFLRALLLLAIVFAFQNGHTQSFSVPIKMDHQVCSRSRQHIGFCLQANPSDKNSVSRRRRRREDDNKRSQPQETKEENTGSTTTGDDSAAATSSTDSSLEDLFGLGNNQLRELMEQELPVPREDMITGEKDKTEQDGNKVFRLPELGQFVKEKTSDGSVSERISGDSRRDRYTMEEGEKGQPQEGEEPEKKIDRSNREEYLRVLQLNPFADADESMFQEEYDIIPSIFGSGKLLGIPIPYLQTGHGILLIISLLSGLIYAPGNPLTEFPKEIRNFLTTGLEVVYSINLVLAVQAFLNAKSKNLPAIFWAAKTFLLGGVAYYEITQARDPKEVNKGPDPSDRKANREQKGVSNEQKYRS